jgi:RNA polymerase sigma-70 factor (ECF subfamily)
MAGLGMSTADLQSDESLMGALRAGDSDALGSLVKRYQKDVYRFSLHYLRDPERAKEIAQETFLRVYTARERFDVERKFKPWLLCIARNLCLNDLKRKRTVVMESLEGYASSAREDSGVLHQNASDGPAELLMAEERRGALMAALDTLPEDAREIVMMRYFQKMQARDIAEVMDSTEGAVRTRLHRILKQLRAVCEPMREES